LLVVRISVRLAAPPFANKSRPRSKFSIVTPSRCVSLGGHLPNYTCHCEGSIKIKKKEM
jgi:hypothetical protein